MVKRVSVAACFLALCACGRVYDGSYAGEPRFVLDGSIVSLGVAPNSFDGDALVHVRWQLIPAPRPPPQSGDASDGATGAGSTVGTPPANPNTGPTDPNVPATPSTPPATSGSDGSVATVRFPAPLSLALYDVPAVGKNPAALALGAMTVFYDVDNDGAFSAADVVAGAAQSHRLVYTDGTLGAVDFLSFAARIDNFAALPRGYSLAEAQCGDGNRLTVHVVENTAVEFHAGDIATCP